MKGEFITCLDSATSVAGDEGIVVFEVVAAVSVLISI
jgi:hypothetical protein